MLRPVERDRLLGHDRARVEPGVHAHQRDGRLGVAGEDRRRDRGGAAEPRQRGRVEVERAVRQVEQRRRDDLAVVREHGEVRAAARGSRRSPRDAGAAAGSGPGGCRGRPRRRRSGSGSSACERPAWRGGAVTTATIRTSGFAASRCRAGTAKAPLPRKTVRTRPSSGGPGLTAIGSGERPQRLLRFLVLVVELAHRDQVVHRLEVVDVQLAVEVVELVLERAAQEARARRP